MILLFLSSSDPLGYGLDLNRTVHWSGLLGVNTVDQIHETLASVSGWPQPVLDGLSRCRLYSVPLLPETLWTAQHRERERERDIYIYIYVHTYIIKRGTLRRASS